MTYAELLATPGLVAAALLFVVGAAAGINLYLTLGALGLASRLELIPPLPPGLGGLENGLVIGTAGVLLLVEALADREHAFAGMWHSLHALVKPLAAALLCASALMGEPLGSSVAACVLAGASALLFHAIRYGARVAVRMPDAPRGSALVTAGEAALALALLATVRFPVAAVPTAAGLLLVGAIAGPLGVRACRLGVSAQRARLRAFLGQSGWLDAARLPGRLRALLPPTPLAGTPPRAARIAVRRAPGIGRYTLGWLVVDAGEPRLLARTWRGVRQVQIATPTRVALRAGTWADEAELEPAAGKLRIFMLKDGPAPALVAHTLAPEPLAAGRVDS